ncbi:MAG: S41 family peptidase [bacterium]
MKYLTILSLSLLLCVTAVAEPISYARYPALSPDNQTIAFTYRGDIWSVPASGGQATRLTIHEAEDIRPQYSPDGKWLMFSSRRHNNYDVFIMPAAGGPARQLTFNTEYDVGTGWFPNSDSVLFTSYRDGRGDIFKVAITGGAPIKLTDYNEEREYDGKLSPDGRWLIYNDGSGPYRWWRRDLRTAGNSDIWLLDRQAAEFTSQRITDWPNHDLWPILDFESGTIYFVSCRGEWAQVLKVSHGGEPAPLTDFSGDGVQWLNSNPQGNVLVFEQNFQIWLLDPATGELRSVPIEISSDEAFNRVEVKNLEGEVEWFSLSPDEKKIAAVAHGEIYILPAEEPEIGRQVTFTGARELYPVWGHDSQTLYYSSDRNGNYDIFSLDVVSGEERQLTAIELNEAKPLVSPDGKYLVYYRGLEQVIRRDLASGAETVWMKGNFFDLGVETAYQYDWSPDSRWLALILAGPTYETDVFVTSLAGDIHNITQFAGWNYRPKFAADGKSIYFTSWFDETDNTYQVALQPEPIEFPEAKIDSLFLAEDKTEKAEDKGDTVAPVLIDFDNITARRKPAFNLSTSSEWPVLLPDAEKFVFVSSLLGKPEIWSVNVEADPELTQLTQSGKAKSFLRATNDGKQVYFLEGGDIKCLELDSKKVQTLKFAPTLEVDLVANNRQRFNEAWRMLNDYFYDQTFRGVDWAAARAKYEPLLDEIRTEPEFDNLMNELMGELKGSHLDIYPRESGPDANLRTGRTGFYVDYKRLDRQGDYQVADVLSDSPAALAGIKAGDFIIAVNDVPLSRKIDIDSLLAGTIGHRVRLTVAGSPEGKPHQVDLKPVPTSALDLLWYEDWERDRRELVDSLSGGRLAYLHIRAMNQPALDRFQRELVGIAEPKDGLIIDVRNNGGGSIAVHLLGMLERTPYILRNFRHFPTTSENKMRSKAFEKPLALLINNYSGSNSEIFTEGFRKLKLGPIIGEPTAGAVIGTGAYSLIDGTRVRRPSWGAYTIEMEDTDLLPRQPDIFVENTPDDYINGRDPQLVRAVQKLLKDLK